jgi:hypothetical protein
VNAKTTAQLQLEQHIGMGSMGMFRLRFLRMTLATEIKQPGYRATGKAPKASTILRKQFGLTGKPERLLAQYDELLTANNIAIPEAP